MLAFALALVIQGQPTPWDPLFSAAGTTAVEVQVPPGKWRGGGKYALDSFNKCWDHWQKLEPATLSMARELRRADPTAALKLAGRELGLDAIVHDDLNISQTISFGKKPKLEDLILACSPASSPLELREAIKKVPGDVSRAAAHIFREILLAEALRREAMDAIKDLGPPASLAPEALAFAKSYDLQPHSLALVDRFDLSSLNSGAQLIAKAVQDAHVSRLRNRPFHFSWPTAIGRIELSGGENNLHDVAGAALIIETGSQCAFKGGQPVTGVSVTVATGSKNYFEDCGLAVFGISEIFDFGAENAYKCKDSGNGAAAFGVSLLVDGGQSLFEGRTLTQGAAIDGIGLLINMGGQSVYKCLTLGQGFAGPKGFGALVDTKGYSEFQADDTKIDNPSPQTAQHNVSMAQGAGFGRRAVPGDGHSMAGGIGLLINGGPKNNYTCGVFGQGVGYWYGFGGIVNFGAGNRFKGVWYVQGSAAHYALGCNLALGGHDFFEATMAQSIGQGHDYSIGLLRSFKGDNSYVCDGGGALGSGRWNGLGLFATTGRNVFSSNGESYGFVADHRPAEGCFGLFAALGQSMFKSAPKEVGAGKRWLFQSKQNPLILGAGYAGR